MASSAGSEIAWSRPVKMVATFSTAIVCPASMFVVIVWPTRPLSSNAEYSAG